MGSKEAILVLETGHSFIGESFGVDGESYGEIVFNTSMVGYPQVITDPSYANQIIVFSYPLIGNYGIDIKRLESERSFCKGVVAREFNDYKFHWDSPISLKEFFYQQNIVAIHKVDTRKIVKEIRKFGTMKAIISTKESDPFVLAKKLERLDFNYLDLVRRVTTTVPYELNPEGKKRIALLDFGVKRGIIRELLKYNLRIKVFPAWSSFEDIKSFNPDGIVLSNGPGDPTNVPYAQETIRKILTLEKPILGICLGIQLLALSLGARTFKLKFGHRGANHPVKDVETGRVYITSQNHSYAVREDTLPSGFKVWFYNLNDGTLEGIKHNNFPLLAVQFHPEASPGPQDTKFIFNEFYNLLD
ncbi:MAG: glutamine-hydrolyzing carbamoyl-phosphate synthase small subunit [Dictyoglomaceae bacterium]